MATTFAALGVPKEIVAVLDQQRIRQPFEVAVGHDP